MATTTVKLRGLAPTAANAHLEKAIEAVARVRSVEMQAGTGEIRVEHDGARPEAILAALKAVGYDEASVID